MSNIEIRIGDNWIAALDESGVYTKFVGYESDIKHIENLIKDDEFFSIREFSLYVRALNLPLSSCCGMVD